MPQELPNEDNVSSSSLTPHESATVHDVDSESVGSVPSRDENHAPVSEFHARKLKERREQWGVNKRVALASVGVVASFFLLAAGSYSYHSGAAADTFLAKAVAAGEQGNVDGQIAWLSRYLLVRPNDLSRVVEIADIADRAAELAPRGQRGDLVRAARFRLAKAIASLGDQLPEESTRLRKRLIRRLLQLGGSYFAAVESQVVLLDAPPDDPFSNKALALALSGQVISSSYSRQNRDAFAFGQEKDYWRWLANQPVGVAVSKGLASNPGDLEVISAFLSLVRNQPQQFRLPSSVEQKRANQASREGSSDLQQKFDAEVVRLTEDALKRVVAMKDVPRAALVLYGYFGRGTGEQRSQANALLISSAVASAERLAGGSEAVSSGDPDAVGSSVLALGAGVPDSYWDYLTVLEAARVEGDNQAQAIARGEQIDGSRVSSWYDTLMDFQDSELSATLRQNTYLNAGQYARLVGYNGRAVEIWSRGLEELNRDNMELLAALLTELSSRESRSEEQVSLSNRSLDQLRQVILRKQTELRESTTSELTDAERNALQRVVERASWRGDISEALLRIAGDYKPEPTDDDENEGSKASDEAVVIGLLREALASPAEVSTEDRVRAATILADEFRKAGAWDQAAETLSRACDLTPSNLSLQLQASEAWARAGNQFKANEHGRVALASNDFRVRIAAAHATLNNQFRRPADAQDFSAVRREAKAIRAKLDSAMTSLQSEEVSDELAEADAFLGILEISVPSRGATPAEHLASPAVAEQFAALARRFPENTLVQAYATERLAAAGLTEASDEAFERIVRLEGADSATAAMTKARSVAIKGRVADAARILLDFLSANSDVEGASAAARMAVDFANRIDDTRLAYEAMLLLPEEMRSPVIWDTLYRQARRLGKTEEAEDHFQELVKAEGEEQGTYWRYIKIEEKIDQLRRRAGTVERSDRDLNEAQRLLTKLIEIRPRWGKALALRAWLSVLSGRIELSVDQLRQAIAAGDQRLSTRRLLWSQQIRIGDFDAADEDIKRTAMASGVDLDPYGAMQVSISLGKGELQEALEEARLAVSNKPDDPVAHVVVAQTASYAAMLSKREGNASTPAAIAKSKAFVKEARDAIRKAVELSEETGYPILATQLGIELKHGDASSVAALESELQGNTDLSIAQRNLLIAQASLYRGDLAEAIERFEAANADRATLRIKLALAELYARKELNDKAAKILGEAVEIAPENGKVKELLAAAIISRDGERVNWSELKELLATGAEADPSNQLLYATMLATRGDKAQLRDSLRILRSLVLENNSKSYLASITLGAVLIKAADGVADADQKAAFLNEAKSVYSRNSRNPQASVDDLYRYAVFLLQHGVNESLPEEEQEQVLGEVDGLAKQLDSKEGGLLRSLEVELILRQRRGQDDSTTEFLKVWRQKSKSRKDADDTEIDLAAGTAFLKLGLSDEGIELFKAVYAEDDSQLFNYVIALSRLRRFSEASSVAATHFRKHQDAQSAMLLVETLLGNPDASASDEYVDLLGKATALHGKDAPLLESVATWAMQSGRVEQAVSLYKRVLEQQPRRLRALNNLAMAYSLMPAKAAEGLELINRALEAVTGRTRAELLDTKGTLLIKMKRFNDAFDTFDQAFRLKPDPRYLFHKILVLAQKGQDVEVDRLWSQLDRDNIDVSALTPDEREIFNQMLSTRVADESRSL